MALDTVGVDVSLQRLQNSLHLAFNEVANFAELIRRQFFGVGYIPAFAALGTDIGARVTATHRRDEIEFDVGQIGEGLGLMLAKVVTQLPHSLDSVGVDTSRRA